MSTFCDRTGEHIKDAIALRPNEGLMIQASS
jgi:hypothetical protein